MDEVYKQAFAEALEVLQNTDENILKKIPEQFITFLNQNKDNQYQVNIDFTNANWEDMVKPETLAILALIYRDYIVSPEEREKLLKEEKEEQIKIENELREKYNPDNIFKTKKVATPNEIQKTETITQLTEIPKYPWYKRIWNKILEIFGTKH